ncbi:MAG: hypothetical protein ABI137_14195 [Antricoccus sp.]
MNSNNPNSENTTDQGPRGPRDGRRGRGPSNEEGHHPFAGKGHGRHGGRGGRGFGRPGGWQQADLPSAEGAAAWFAGRLPEDLYLAAPQVSVDREEIIVIGEIAAPDQLVDTDQASTEAAIAGRISRFREDTREQRMAVASEAQDRYGRKVAWGARIGETEVVFSNLATPVMTRLRQNERQVLDTLVDSGVARSRSDALAWAVKLVGEHTEEWLSNLRQAMAEVDTVRANGPQL